MLLFQIANFKAGTTGYIGFILLVILILVLFSPIFLSIKKLKTSNKNLTSRIKELEHKIGHEPKE